MNLEELADLREALFELKIIAELRNNSLDPDARLEYQKAAMSCIKWYCIKHNNKHRKGLVSYYLNNLERRKKNAG